MDFMPTHAFDFEIGSVLPFMQSLSPGLSRSDDTRVIGLRKNGELVAGVAFDGFNGRNVWMHVAAVPGSRWMVREYLFACFAYPFNICGVDRVSGYVNASNLAARKFDEHIGFQEEARLHGAAPDGGDVILYVMWRKDCRYVDSQ